MTERQRRDRLIAWGVSPRYWVSQHPEAPERGRQISAAASAAAAIFRLSVAASRLEDLFPCCIPGAHAPGYESVAASRLDGMAACPILGADAPGYVYAAASGFVLPASRFALRRDRSHYAVTSRGWFESSRRNAGSYLRENSRPERAKPDAVPVSKSGRQLRTEN